MMLPEIVDFARVKVDLTRDGHLSARPPLVMYHLRLGNKGHTPARVGHAPAPVQFLRVHENVRVQQPHLGHCRSAHHQARAGHPIDVRRGVCWHIFHAVAARPRIVREPLFQHGALPQRLPERRETPTRGLHRAVSGTEYRPGYADIRMSVHIGHEGLDRVPHHHGVRVEEQQIVASGTFQGEVVPANKAQIGVAGNQGHVRELGADHGGAAVPRGIVHHEDLDVASTEPPGAAVCVEGHRHQHGTQAIPQQIAHVPVDDEDTEVDVHLVHPEKAQGVGCSTLRDLAHLQAQDLSQPPSDAHDVRGLVALAAKRLWCQVRAVRLDQKAVERYAPDDVDEAFRVPKGDWPGDTHVQPPRQRPACNVWTR